MRTEADNRVLTIEPLDEGLQCALEVTHCDAFIDYKTFDLVEHGGVRGIRLILTEDAAGR